MTTGEVVAQVPLTKTAASFRKSSSSETSTCTSEVWEPLDIYVAYGVCECRDVVSKSASGSVAADEGAVALGLAPFASVKSPAVPASSLLIAGTMAGPAGDKKHRKAIPTEGNDTTPTSKNLRDNGLQT